MGIPRKFQNVKQLEDAWQAFKDECNNQVVLTHEFSAKNSEFVSRELKRSITYTIEGFCVYAGISRSAFYETYGESKQFSDMVTRIREECEVDARRKFELGVIPTQLAGLWMSRHGYSAKTEANVDLEPVVILNDLKE